LLRISIYVPGSTGTVANGVNNAGQIVGTFSDSSGGHGFLYSGGVYPKDLTLSPSETKSRWKVGIWYFEASS